MNSARNIDLRRNVTILFDRDVFAAPKNVPLMLRVRDGNGEYSLPFPSMRLDDGTWVNADLGTLIGDGIRVVGWRIDLAHGKTRSEHAGTSA